MLFGGSQKSAYFCNAFLPRRILRAFILPSRGQGWQGTTKGYKSWLTPVKTRLDDESLKQLHDSHTQWLGQEKQTLDHHHKQQEDSWQKHSQRLTDIVKNNEGVWISTKLFYIVGSLSLLSIITIAIEIAFSVYFKWIAWQPINNM